MQFHTTTTTTTTKKGNQNALYKELQSLSRQFVIEVLRSSTSVPLQDNGPTVFK